MTKIQRILAGILALQLLAAVVVFWPRNVAGAETVAFFDGVTADQVVGLSIVDNEGARVDLARQGDGWVLADGGDYPAKTETITPVLDKIVALQSNRLVARTAASQKQLQVAADDFVRQVTVTLADGSSKGFYLGSATNFRATNFRMDGQNNTYLVADLNIYELSANATSWVDTAYVSGIAQDSVTGLTLSNGDGTLTFVKDDAGTWTLDGLAEGEMLDTTLFNSLLSRVINLRLVQPLGTTAADYGMDQPQATITVVSSGDAGTQTDTITVGGRLGDQDDDPSNNNYIVKWSGSPYYVAVAPFSAQDLVNQGRADFIQVPTPEPVPSDATPAP